MVRLGEEQTIINEIEMCDLLEEAGRMFGRLVIFYSTSVPPKFFQQDARGRGGDLGDKKMTPERRPQTTSHTTSRTSIATSKRAGRFTTPPFIRRRHCVALIAWTTPLPGSVPPRPRGPRSPLPPPTRGHVPRRKEGRVGPARPARRTGDRTTDLQ